MKHHFADLLDRDGKYWTIVPNIERYAYSLNDKIVEKEKVRIVTISKDQIYWKQVFDLPNLEELTLHGPSKVQLESVGTLKQIKRLRITHARPKNINFVSKLVNLEECVFEYVSGFSDLSPFRELKKLKSLHFENLRRVTEFGGLSGLDSLKYLYITGTLDWNQPIENFIFLDGLPKLEVFSLGWITNKSDFPTLFSVLKLKHLKKINVIRNTFPTKEYAFLEMALPNVKGASWELFWDNDGRRDFLGKKAGWTSPNSPKACDKCLEFEKKYGKMKIDAEELINVYKVANK